MHPFLASQNPSHASHDDEDEEDESNEGGADLRPVLEYRGVLGVAEVRGPDLLFALDVDLEGLSGIEGRPE